MKLKEFLNKYGFIEQKYMKVIKTRYYKVAKNGSFSLISYLRTLRKIDGYRITATHFNGTVPYTIYYLVDKNNKVYKSNEFPSYIKGTLNEIIEDLKSVVRNDT